MMKTTYDGRKLVPHFLSKPWYATQAEALEAERVAQECGSYRSHGAGPRGWYVVIVDPRTTDLRELCEYHRAHPNESYFCALCDEESE